MLNDSQARKGTQTLQVPTVDMIEEAIEEERLKSDFEKDDLEAIRVDICRIILPSFVESPPRNFGCKSHGKLKANTWFIFLVICAPITFIRLFAELDKDDRKRVLMEHLLHLSNALAIASSRSLNAELIGEFRRLLEAYILQIPLLFPDRNCLVPNHHMALHVWEYMVEFGPVYSWWAYPYERVNGIIQKTKSNFKSCECLAHSDQTIAAVDLV